MTISTTHPKKNIADPYQDLLAKLDEGRRLGLIRRLAVGYYDGWQPSRAELALLIEFELGRISEDEYLAASQPAAAPTAAPQPVSVGGFDMPSLLPPGVNSGPRPAGLRAGTATIMRPEVPDLAAFTVDCGLLAPPFRFVARGLSNDGTTLRNGICHRLMTLHYELILPAAMPGKSQIPFVPVIFAAAIICVPDGAAPWSEGDGRSRKHAVRNRSVVGSRGPWPLAEGVRRVVFLICEQSPPGVRPVRHPAGSLQVDLHSGHAVWRPVSARADHTGSTALRARSAAS